jgi:hypothetical protein
VPNVTPHDNHASAIPNQIPNSDRLVSFGFFCCPNYQSIGCLKYLNLIAQVIWRCSFAVLSFSGLASRDRFVVRLNYVHAAIPTRWSITTYSCQAAKLWTPETRKSNFPKQNYKWETVNSAALLLTERESIAFESELLSRISKTNIRFTI